MLATCPRLDFLLGHQGATEGFEQGMEILESLLRLPSGEGVGAGKRGGMAGSGPVGVSQDPE